MSDLSGERRQLHELVDSLPPDQVPAAVRYLHYLSADPMLLSLINAPPDDEPYTDAQRKTDAAAEEAIIRSGGVTHEEVLREFGL